MTQDEIIRVVLALAIGLIIFTVFKKNDSSLDASTKRAKRNARLAMILFICGSCMALLYMAVNADL